MCTLILDNKLYLAPIEKTIQKALDIGTGTGIWAIDFADEHPSATVIGTDISPIQPTWVPPNLKFEIDDAQLEWTFADNDFDYIHIRCLMGSIDNWPLLYQRAFKATKPGGYIEHLDMDIQFTSDDGTVKEGDIMYEWSKVFIGAGEMMGRTFTIARNSKQLLEEAGFVDVVEKTYKIPVGGWMEDPKWKEIGRWDLLYLTTGLEGMALYILKNVLGWEFVQIQVYLAAMRKALLNKHLHGYYPINVVYGRKPGSSTE
ncbi:SAM dependent methyltransferase [Cadophora sp. DSE1049]|nr:SAM dependent methyltransferase [Cadophora sp. DSE1049]